MNFLFKPNDTRVIEEKRTSSEKASEEPDTYMDSVSSSDLYHCKAASAVLSRRV